MMKQPIDYLKEARLVAAAAGLFFSGQEGEYRVFRKTPARAVFLGTRSKPAGLCSFVKRCAGSK